MDFDVIDIHHHVGTGYGFTEYRGTAASDAPTADQIAGISGDESETQRRIRIEIMDRNNVSRAVVMPSHAYTRSRGLIDTRAVNDRIATYATSNPSRFVAAVGIVEPTHGLEGLDEVGRLQDIGIVGVSFHCRFHGLSLGSPWVRRYVEEVHTQNLIPLIHVSPGQTDEALWKFELLVSSFPDTTFIALDALESFESLNESFVLAGKCKNIVFDMSSARSVSAMVQFAETHGADRLIYGTRQNTANTVEAGHGDRFLRELLASRLSNDQKESIVSGNATRIFRL